MSIHPTAIIHPRAEVDGSAEIGAYAVIEAGVRISAGCRIYPHAYVSAGTTLDAEVQLHPFAVVGHHPQDLAWKETPSYTTIGANTIIREHATVHRGTPPESTTVIGRRCFLMSTAHVGHNCVLGDDVKIANGGLLSGWVQVGSGAFISGNVAIHQFARIGELVMVGGLTRITGDVPPFMMVSPHGVTGPNVIGLRRAGLTADDRQEIRALHRLLYRNQLPWKTAVERVCAAARGAAARRLVAFLQAPSKRGFHRSRRGGRAAIEAAAPETECES